MKKVFGILLLLIGLALTNIGIGAAVYNETQRTNEMFKTVEEISGYRNNYETEIAIGMAIFVIGLILFIVGIVLTATKTKKQKETEIELSLMKAQIIK